MRTLPPFFCGKLINNGVVVFAAKYAAASFTQGTFSLKGILLIIFGLVLIGGVLFVDWRSWLERGTPRLEFRIWK